jgi:adenylyltransferase/sulfurtransferase
MSWWNSQTIEAATVLVVGAGALGNEILKNLALLGVGQIIIVDYDEIEYTNLSRSILYRPSDLGRKKHEVAAQRIREINPNVKVLSLEGDISCDVGLGVFRRADVVIGGLDNRLARLSINQSCYKVGKTWIDGGIQDLAGQANVYKPGKTCYECGLTTQERADIRAKLSCNEVVQERIGQGSIATTPISASIVGAIQAQEALKVIFAEEERFQMVTENFYYEGRSNTVLQRLYPELQTYCQSHLTYTDIVESPLSHRSTVAEVLAWCREQFADDDPAIQLDHELVLEVTGRQSGRVTPTLLSKAQLRGERLQELQGAPGEGLILTQTVDEIAAETPQLQDQSLQTCGIPPLHILTVLTAEGKRYVELTADTDLLVFN